MEKENSAVNTDSDLNSKGKAEKTGGRKKGKKRLSRVAKIVIAVSLSVVLIGGAIGIGSLFFKDAKRNNVSLDYGSVSQEVKKGEVYSPDGGYDAIDIFARLNWTFAHQSKWYSYMSSTVDTVVQQEVKTFKQYNDGILISADITKSSIVNGANQFCYIKDRDLVMWRGAAGGPSTYNGLETEWKSGAPAGIMSISGKDGFKAKNGLPAYELSVYVIEENTVESASDVSVTEDGLFRITYVLKPDNWTEEDENGGIITKGATAYYANQMIFTGGLSDTPTFQSISATFTFDENWRVTETYIEESYHAKFGPISAGCASKATTYYEYNTANAESDAYKEYFEQYAGEAPSNTPSEKKVTALNCLAEAFGDMLVKPSVLNLDLDINDEKLNGVVNLDLSKTDFNAFDMNAVEGKARLGEINLWVENGTVYIGYGDLHVSAKIEEIINLIPDQSEGIQAQSEARSTDDLLSALANGEFTYGDGKARLYSVLPIAGLEIPIDFRFNLDGELTASLEKATAIIKIDDSLTVSAEITFGEEQLPDITTEEKNTDVNLIPYVQSLINLFSSENLTVNLSYASEDGTFGIQGELLVNLSDLTVKSDLKLYYLGTQKAIKIIYTDGSAYIELEGIRIKANTEDVLELVGRYYDIPELDTKSSDLLKNILNLKLDEIISLSESNSTLTVLLKTSALMNELGKDFDLGDVQIAINENGLVVSALGAEVEITRGNAFEIDTEDYIDIVKYAGFIADMVAGGYLKAEVGYDGEFTVNGDIKVALNSATVIATLNITYRQINKSFEIFYTAEGELGGYIYICVDGTEFKANLDEAIGIITGFFTTDEKARSVSGDILENILSLDFTEVINLREEGDILSIVLAGTEILKQFGIEFEIGETEFLIGENFVSVSALGTHVAVTGIEAFEIETDKYSGYVDVTSVIAEVADIISSMSVRLRGETVIQVGDTELVFEISEGVISWKNGLQIYLNTRMVVLGTEHDIVIYADGDMVKVAYGEVGFEVALNDLDKLEESFVALYNRIRDMIDSVLTDDNDNPLPKIDGISDLLALLKGGEKASLAMDSLFETDFDWTEIVKNIVIDVSKLENGILSLGYNGFTVDLINETGSEDYFGGLGMVFGYESEEISVSGRDIHVGVNADGMIPAMPENVDYLDIDDFAEFLDYIGATVGLIAEENLYITLDGEVRSTDEKYVEYDGLKYKIDCDIDYYSGGGMPFSINVNGKQVDINTKLYLKLSFTLVASLEGDNSIYLDLTVIDSDMNGNQDGILDFYVSVSCFDKDNKAYEPLLVYAPSSEIMTILSGALAMLGVDNEFLNDYLISQWITGMNTVGQLRAFGDSFMPLLSGLLGGNTDEAEPVNVVSEVARRNFLESFKRVESGYEFTLNSQAIYGLTGLENITFKIEKKQGANDESILSLVSLKNLYSADGTERTDLTVTIETPERSEEPAVPSVEGYYSFEGADSLILAIANSATHKVDANEYAINNSFFIDGSIKLSALGLLNVVVTIDGLHVTIDKDGQVEVNLRMNYPGLAGGLIEGASNVELTVKYGMVYIKRIQKTEFGGFLGVQEKEISPITVYRAMPVDVFMADIMEQMIFLFNFGDTIASRMRKDGNQDSGEEPAVKEDYGTQLKKYFNGLTFTKTEETLNWQAKINGKGLSELAGIKLGDITATFGAVKDSGDGYLISDLGIEGSIFYILSFTATLKWQNPQEIWSNDSAKATSEEMVADNPSLKISKWLGGTTYEEICKVIEWNKLPNTVTVKATDENGEEKEEVYHYFELSFTGDAAEPDGTIKFGTVEYYRMSDVGAEAQEIAICNADILYYGSTILTILAQPDVSEYDNIAHYSLKWLPSVRSGNTFRIVADYIPDVYEVTFDSEYEIDGYDHVYGDSLSFNFGYEIDWHKIDYIVYNGVTYYEHNYTDIVIGDDAIIYVHWVEIPRATVTLVSEYEVDGFTFNEESGKWEFIEDYRTDKAVTLRSDYEIEGYEFTGYSDGAGNMLEEYTLTLTGDTTYYLNWKTNRITVVYYSSLEYVGSKVYTGSVEGYDTVYYSEVEMSNDYTVATVTSEGYQFLGWFYYEDSTKTWIVVSDIMKDINGATAGETYGLHALWVKIAVSVSGKKNTSSGWIKTYSYDLSADIEVVLYSNSNILGLLNIDSMDFRYYVDDNGGYAITNHKSQNGVLPEKSGNNYTVKGNQSTNFNVKSGYGNFSKANVVVSFALKLNGETIKEFGDATTHATSALI